MRMLMSKDGKRYQNYHKALVATLVEEATAPGAGKEKGLTDEARKVLLAASDDLANADRNQSRGTANYNAAWEALEEVTELLE